MLYSNFLFQIVTQDFNPVTFDRKSNSVSADVWPSKWLEIICMFCMQTSILLSNLGHYMWNGLKKARWNVKALELSMGSAF